MFIILAIAAGGHYFLLPHIRQPNIKKILIKKDNLVKPQSQEIINIDRPAGAEKKSRIINEWEYRFKSNSWENAYKKEYTYFSNNARKDIETTWCWKNNRWTTLFKDEFWYYPNDSLQLMKHYFFRNGKMEYLYRYCYEYNNENKLSKLKILYNREDSLKDNAIFDYEYIKDIDGVICILRIITQEGSKIADTTYFDKGGRKVESINRFTVIAGDTRKKSFYKRTLNYDYLGRLALEVFHTEQEGEVTNHYECYYSYDQSGFLVSKLFNFIKDGVVIGKTRKQYFYDNNKNNFEGISEDWDGKNFIPSGKYVRTYESYNNPS